MSDKITFLGTGGDTEVVGKQIRASGGIVLQTSNNQFLIDPGPGCLVRAKQYGINLRENTVLIVTSNSLINAGDINAAIDATTVGGLDKKAVLVCNSSLMNGMESADGYLNKEHKNSVERILVVKPGQKLGINDTEVEVVSAKQKDENALGFKFTTPTATITYTGDTAFFKEMVEEYADSDILIMNVQQPFDEEEENNMNVEDAIKILSKVQPKIAVLNHFGIKMLREDIMALGREIQKQTGCQVTMVKDGSTIDTVGMVPKTKQEKLNEYPEKSVIEESNEEDVSESD